VTKKDSVRWQKTLSALEQLKLVSPAVVAPGPAKY
jgi:hypothetical protein